MVPDGRVPAPGCRFGKLPGVRSASTKAHVHPTADVAADAKIGSGTRVWNQAQIREGAVIGSECVVGKGAYVDQGVRIGDRCKLQNGVSVYHGFELEDGVFLGPGVMLLNDQLPRAITPDGSLKSDADWVVAKGRICRGASIGGGAVRDVLESGMLVQGPRVAELERRFAQQVGVRHAVATSSGTTALHLALIANGIGPGDEVITSPFTFVASANAMLYVGAKPVFVDVDDDTFNLNVSQIEAAITPRTRAIMPVHLFGHPAPMDEIVQLAERRSLRLIEDCAQSIGATYHARPTGTFGTGCFSLYATKTVTSGEC